MPLFRNVHFGVFLYPAIASLQSLDIGATVGWSVTLGQFLSQAHPLRVLAASNHTEIVPGFSQTTISWIFTAPTLTFALTSLFFGHSMKYFSSKGALIFFGMFKVIFWLLILFYDNTEFWLIFSRVCLGFGQILFATVPLYIEEITEAKHRGFYISMSDCFLNIGILLAYVLGTTVAYEYSLWILSMVSLLSWLASSFLPQSPVWLKHKGFSSRALQSLKRTRAKKHDFKTELNNIEKYLQMQSEQNLTFLQLMKFLKSKRIYCNRLLLVLSLFLFQHLSAIVIMQHYALGFVQQDNHLEQFLITFFNGVGCLLGSISASCFTDRFGRRILFLASEGSVILCLTILSLYSMHILSWHFLPFLMILVHGFSVNIGLGPLPYVIMTEILPYQLRTWGSYLGILISGLACFTLNKTFFSFANLIGHGGVFAIYALFNILGFCIIYFFLPETKQIPRHLIEQHLNHKEVERIIADDLENIDATTNEES